MRARRTCLARIAKLAEEKVVKIVGGVSFMGSESNIPALVTGVFVLAVLGNGMQLAGWGTYAQYIVRGIILLDAVAFDDYQRNAKRTKRLAR